MPLPEWVEEYIGIPYKRHGRDISGLDCWGIVMRVYEDRYGIKLPGYDFLYEEAAEAEEVRALLTGEDFPWVRVNPEDVREGDVVWFSDLKDVVHMGVMLDRIHFLHCARHTTYSSIEKVTGPLWCNRIEGFYRHKAMRKDD